MSLAHRHVASRRTTSHEDDAHDDQNDRTRDEDLKCSATKVGVDPEDLLDPVHHMPPSESALMRGMQEVTCFATFAFVNA